MQQQAPTIRFKYGWLIAGEASSTLNDVMGDGTPLRSYDEYEAVAKKYQDWWSPVGDQILQNLQNILKINFSQSEIDVYVVPWFNAISDPLILGPAFRTQDELINTLTHELIHRLLTENNVTDFDYSYIPAWKRLFGDHEFNTLVHIPVHAVMKTLYTKHLGRPDLVELDKQLVKDNDPYVDAWSYVDRHGDSTVLHKLIQWYSALESHSSS